MVTLGAFSEAYRVERRQCRARTLAIQQPRGRGAAADPLQKLVRLLEQQLIRLEEK